MPPREAKHHLELRRLQQRAQGVLGCRNGPESGRQPLVGNPARPDCPSPGTRSPPPRLATDRGRLALGMQAFLLPVWPQSLQTSPVPED